MPEIPVTLRLSIRPPGGAVVMRDVPLRVEINGDGQVLSAKGEGEGHPFRGNQWTAGGGGQESGDKAVGTAVKDAEVDAQGFSAHADVVAFQSGIAGMPENLRPFISTYSDAEYKAMNAELHISGDGKSGYAVKPDGELISVFSQERGRGAAIMASALAHGANHLDCFDTYLAQDYYPRFGFRETGRVAWDDQYAPPIGITRGSANPTWCL